jgi:hypothetical protein
VAVVLRRLLGRPLKSVPQADGVTVGSIHTLAAMTAVGSAEACNCRYCVDVFAVFLHALAMLNLSECSNAAPLGGLGAARHPLQDRKALLSVATRAKARRLSTYSSPRKSAKMSAISAISGSLIFWLQRVRTGRPCSVAVVASTCHGERSEVDGAEP